MIDLNKMRRRDLEQLSAYIDGELNEKEARRVEARIETDSAFGIAFRELQNTRKLVAELPALRPPRDFTLTPEMAGMRSGMNLFPVFRFATVIATLAFAVLVGADVLLLGDSGGVPILAEPARFMAENDVEGLAAVEEQADNALEAPLEDAVIGAATDEIMPADAEAFAPEAMPMSTEGAPAQREPGFQGFGTDTGEGLVGEETKVETTSTPAPAGTQTPSDEEQPIEEERAIVAPAESEPAPTEVVEPSPVPIAPVEPRPTVDPLRISEVGLAILALLSAAITFILRRAR